ncbi:D-2-hydroxyacid dehydrogenase [Evansella sp. AB-P1]|uniref:D-2-hydroxyacid dehydrogenase n=1 Tax=Evansella sp. AB-P1 TaxID=3037653 RepID=UPI00241BEC6E|nr:D-2-hydroxyacid dehydrogenase [Evansella sp. AB-P1]MDG5786281.1 D-2-hydroxyacid dehydrogenase [Evansella sp. AB-P1]
MKVVSSAKIRRDIRERLVTNYPELSFSFYTNIEAAEKELLDADILITYGEDVTSKHIEKCVRLKWIMVISAGIDQLPFEAIKKRSILVTNVSGIHKIPMAEYTIAMMLQIAREAKSFIKNEQNKRWERKIKMTELHGKTVGILGAGSIGQEIARLSKAFGMKTIGLNRSGREVQNFDDIVTYKGLESLLKQSDFIVGVLPKTKETDDLLAMNEFKLMKKEAILINIGRGNVIKDEDLIEALNNGELAHAALDVFDEEPLPENHPYWEMESVTVTPHISGISPEYQPRAIDIFELNLKEFLLGQENYINKIDLNKGY